MLTSSIRDEEMKVEEGRDGEDEDWHEETEEGDEEEEEEEEEGNGEEEKERPFVNFEKRQIMAIAKCLTEVDEHGNVSTVWLQS